MAEQLWPELLGQAWAALAVDADDDIPAPARLEVTGDLGHLPSRLPVEDTAIACVGAALLAAAGFAPLSRFWRAADGWVRTHANYPWHREALLRALGTADDPAAVATATARLTAREVENLVVGAGGVRPPGELDGHGFAWPYALSRYGGDPATWAQPTGTSVR